MLIDLDLHQPDIEVSERPRRRVHRHVLIGLLVVAVALSTVGGHESVPRPTIERIADLESEFVSWVSAEGSTLLVAGPRHIAAYDFRDGRVKWRQNTAMDPQAVYVRDGMMIMIGLGAGTMNPAMRTAAFDPESGAVRWQVPGWVEWFDDDLFAAVEENYIEGAEITGVARFFRGDGTEIWSLEVGRAVAFDLKRLRVGMVDRYTGMLTERDARTGAVVRELLLPDAIGADGLWYQEDSLLVFRSEADTAVFDTRSLARVERSPFPDFDVFRTDCGKVWCQPDVENHGYELVDKTSDRVVFHDTRWEMAIVTVGGILGAVYSGDGRPSVVLNIFDPRTRRTTELPGWNLLGGNMAELPGPTVEMDPVYLFKATQGLTHFARVTAEGVRYIGATSQMDIRECAAFEQWLACRIDLGVVRVWRLT